MEGTSTIDDDILAMVDADVIIRKVFKAAPSRFYLIEGSWTMALDPYRVRWNSMDNEICAAHLVGEPVEGDRLVMFTCADENAAVFQLVAFKENYFSMDTIKDITAEETDENSVD